MTKRNPSDPKTRALREQGSLHPHAEKVADALFQQGPFFDRHDIVQVKYEMLRRVQTEGASVQRCASAFGLSRQSFYQTQAAFTRAGLPGLGAPQAGTAWRPQAYRKGDAVCSRVPYAATIGAQHRAGRAHPPAFWAHDPSANPGASAAAAAKRGAIVGSDVANPMAAGHVVLARYEEMRQVVLEGLGVAAVGGRGRGLVGSPRSLAWRVRPKKNART